MIIMLTPVRRIFHCEEQNGFEWLYAILTGAGSLLVALATKLITWCALALPRGDCLGCLCVKYVSGTSRLSSTRVNGKNTCPCHKRMSRSKGERIPELGGCLLRCSAESAGPRLGAGGGQGEEQATLLLASRMLSRTARS